jgi:hypothetical protein
MCFRNENCTPRNKRSGNQMIFGVWLKESLLFAPRLGLAFLNTVGSTSGVGIFA